MNKNVNKRKYEGFHRLTTSQRKIIFPNNFTYRHIIHYINKYLSKDKRVLDIGCGAGTLCFYIASKGNHVVGFDISPKAIKSCTESAQALGLEKLAKFEIASFPEQLVEGKFDLIIFSEVIEHIQDDNLALRKIYGKLNDKGVLIVTTPSQHAPLHRLGYAKGFDKRVGHLRRYTTEVLSKQCVDAGFKIVETYRIEGILRNFLFISPLAGKLVRFIKFTISDAVTFIDNLTIPIFGESNIIVVVRKNN